MDAEKTATEEEQGVLRDRNGKVIKTIYRSREAMKPAPTGLNNDRETARRRRQRERKEAKDKRRSRLGLDQQEGKFKVGKF
jgi:hypothetical protein